MRRTRLDVVRGDTVEGTLAGSVPDGVPELSRYDTCPSPRRPAARGELLQRVLAVPPDGADDGREIHLRADGGLLRGKADGGQVHGAARSLLKDREVTFDRRQEKFRIAPISQKEEQKEEQKQGERQRQERNEAPKRRGGMKI